MTDKDASNPRSIFGVGPWILLPSMTLALGLYAWGGQLPEMYWQWLDADLALGFGGIIALIGIAQLRMSGKIFLEHFAEGKLVTEGPYAKCRNPIYCVWIFWMIPALAVATRFWPFLAASLVAYVLLNRLVKKEETVLEKEFGEVYKVYRAKTPITAVWLFK